MKLPEIYRREISEYSDKEFGECLYKKKSRLEKELTLTSTEIKKAERAIQNRWILDATTSPELFSEEEMLELNRTLGVCRIATVKYNNGGNDLYIGYDKLNNKFRVGDNKGNIKPTPVMNFGMGIGPYSLDHYGSWVSDGFTVDGAFEEIINNETIKKEIKNLVNFYEELRTIIEKYKEY